MAFMLEIGHPLGKVLGPPLINLMDTLDLSYITHIADVNAAVDELIGRIYSLYDAHCPMKSVKISANDPPYITPLVKTLLLKRNRLLRNGRHAQALEIQERINSAVQGNLQNTSSKGSKHWWEVVNYHRGKKATAPSITIEPDVINDYYASIATIPQYHEPDGMATLDTVPIFTMHQVYYSLRRTGPDRLPAWVFFDNADNLAEILTWIYNRCLETATYPDQFKVSRIVPIPKKPVPALPSDLRPISITPIISRSFERLLYDCFLEVPYNKFLRRDQFGFRNGGSTECALLKILNVCKDFDDRKFDYIRIYSLDLSKAFDRVPHTLIITVSLVVILLLNSDFITWLDDRGGVRGADALLPVFKASSRRGRLLRGVRLRPRQVRWTSAFPGLAAFLPLPIVSSTRACAATASTSAAPRFRAKCQPTHSPFAHTIEIAESFA